MGAGKQAWGWYPAGKIWVPMQVAVDGSLVIDPTALFEEPPTNGEMEKAATSNWSFDHDADPDAHHARLHTMTDALDHTGRIALTQMTDGAAGLVLTGQGAGSDPVYAAPAAGAVVKASSYTGNSTPNRAIAHGLGVTPKIVFIWDNTDNDRAFKIWGALAKIMKEYNVAVYAVTIPDSTNFYVGNASGYGDSANGAGATYYWVAIG